MAQTADVFISYSREDKDRVAELAEKLRASGVSLWIDQGGIDGAAKWSEEIVNALDNAKVLLLMVTEKSVTSHNVVKEVTLASERKGHILPVHLESTRIPADLRYPLAGLQHIEYFTPGSDDGIRSIIRSLERLGVTIQKVEPLAATGPAAAPEGVTSASIPDAGIAVLPFENASSDPEADYFSDGLSDELIASLSQVGELDVVSRLTSVQYKGTKKDARTIAQEIQARYIVSGTVRKFQDNIRMTAQMVDAQTNKQLWAKTYKGTLDDIFDIQEQVAQQIADALKLKLSLTEKVSLTKRPTVNAQAYDLYLRGKEYLYQLTKKSVEYSIQLFEKAIELDPRYAEAYASCSSAYGLLYGLFKRNDALLDKGQELGFKALMYDNTSAEAYTALSLSYYYRQLYEEAISAGKRAISLDADNFLSHWLVGRVYFSMGLFEDARAALERSLHMEQNFYTTYNDLEMTYDALGLQDKSQAMVEAQLVFLPTHLLKYPDDNRARLFLAYRFAIVGREKEAREELKRALAVSSDDPLVLYNAVCVYSKLGDIRLAIQTLRAAFQAGYEYADWIKRDSSLDPLRDDPEYIELMKGR